MIIESGLRWISSRMGRAKRNPPSGGGSGDGFRLSPLPILRGLTETLGEYLFEGLDRDPFIDAGLEVRIRVCPGFGLLKRIKFNDQEATGKTRGSGVFAVNCRKGSGH